MRPIGTHNYFVYILTNENKSVLYIGVTNNLLARLEQHKQNEVLNNKSFTGRYNVHYLLYYERHGQVEDAIDREKQLKRWSRKKKEQLIESMNPDWIFLNEEITDL